MNEFTWQVRAAAALALLLCLSGGLIKAFEINPKDPIPDCSELTGARRGLEGAKKNPIAMASNLRT